MLGKDVSEAEKVPHFHFSTNDLGWDPVQFDGYGTLYHDDNKRGIQIQFYLWNGADEADEYIRTKLTEAGYDVDHLTSIWGGNGHYSLIEGK